MKLRLTLFLAICLTCLQYVHSQYSTGGLDWNTSAYGKFTYTSPVGDGTMPYRLLVPPQNDLTKKYPLTIMLHGLGEGINEACTNQKGINECNLTWGGKMELDSVNKYPGFVVFPQTYSGNWATTGGSAVDPGKPMRLLAGLLESLFKTYNIDLDRVSIYGLSGGGQGTWEMALRYPHLFSAVSPLSAGGESSRSARMVYNSLWTVQGELDTNPLPKTSIVAMDTLKKYNRKVTFTYNYLTGSQMWPSSTDFGSAVYSLIPNTEHEAWPFLFNSPSWLGWKYNQSKNRIVVIGRTEITPGETVRLGIAAGFDAYEWSTGETTNEIKVSQAGSYRVRYLRKQYFFSGTPVWSDWSEPVNITEVPGKGPYVDAGSDTYSVYPNNSVTLRGQGYGKNITYSWTKISGSSVSYKNQNTNSLIINSPGVGNYTFRLTVTDANGIKVYDDVNLKVTAPSSIQTVTSFVLVNTDTGKDIMTINDGDNVDLSTLPSRNLNIKAITTPSSIGSIVFYYDGPAVPTDNTAPYTVFGDTKSFSTITYKGQVIPVGTHTITAFPYSSSNNTGTLGVGMTVKVNFFDSQILPASGNAVVSFVLMNADTDTEIKSIKNGETIVLQNLPTRNINIKVVTNPQVIGYVVSNYDATKIVDNESPYSVFGNTGADFKVGTLDLGTHQLTATPFLYANGISTVGSGMTINFTVVEELLNQSLSVVSFTLVNADTEKDIRTINDGDIINLSSLPSQNINIRANTNPSTVGSVVFNYDNTMVTQNKSPYALYGWDRNYFSTKNPINYRSGKLTTGSHILIGIPYTSSNGTGDKGVYKTIRFKVVQSALKMAAEIDNNTFDQSEEIIVYPNPITANEVHIKFKESQTNVKVTIVDMFGGLVYESATLEEITEELTINLSNSKITTGTYFLTVQTDKFNKKLRIMK